MQLWKKMLLGLVLGVVAGLLLSPEGAAMVGRDTATAIADWVYVPGALFLGLIKMVVIPLVVCSIILGVTSSGDMDYLKHSGWRIGVY